jgi:hypothetical protein
MYFLFACHILSTRGTIYYELQYKKDSRFEIITFWVIPDLERYFMLTRVNLFLRSYETFKYTFEGNCGLVS